MSLITPFGKVVHHLTRRAIPLLILATILGSLPVSAQDVSRVGNRDIAAHVVTSPKQGRFWITGGSDYGDTLKFLYASGASYITSNLIFRISRQGTTQYFCNTPNGFLQRPINPTTNLEIPFVPFDSSYVSKDTLAIYYRNMAGFTITVRFMPEKRQTVYDRGSDMLIEFDYSDSPFAEPGTLGILMMLDTYNNNATSNSGGGTGDNASIATNLGYYPSGNFGAKFAQPFDSIPAWYHVGNFTVARPLNTLFPIHRLRDTSHGGRRLTTPNIFAIGSWLDFRRVGWDVPSNVGGQIFNDAATLVRWDQLQGEGKVVTAFGLSDKEGNNMFTCRDSSLFIDIRAQRVVTQKVKGGPFNPSQIQVDMWVHNTEDRFGNNVSIELGSPILTNPLSNGRLTLDPSTPPRIGVQLRARETKKISWKLNVAAGTPDTVEAQLRFSYIYDQKPIKTFREGCTPKITILGFQDPPPPQDTLAPVISKVGSGRDTTAFTTFRTFDRHPGYIYDTGLDRVERPLIINHALYESPQPLIRCNTTVDRTLEARVIDTTKPARIIFQVFDCRGNSRIDSASYTPFPDVTAPRIESIDTVKGQSVPCNARQYAVRLSDTTQGSATGDAGFGSAQVVGVPENFTFELNYDNGGRAIAPFDRFATFRVAVIDSMKDGTISIRYADYAGNSRTIDFFYCTLPDVLPPVIDVTPLPSGKSWRVEASDSLAWDRGLYGVNVLANPGGNMRLTPDPVVIVPGAKNAMFTVDVIDDRQPGTIRIEVTDLRYLDEPQGHADTLELVYNSVPDDRAPNIGFVNVADPKKVLFDVNVDDIHYDGTDLYRYDLGLREVNILLISANFSIVNPISLTPTDRSTTFRVEVTDTLAFSEADTLVVEAIDLAGNRTVDTLYYPIKPDRLSPRFDGAMDDARTEITGIASDQQPYDRGLGSIVLENPVNLDPSFALTGLNGMQSTRVTIRVVDPEEPVSGTIRFRDLVGDMDNSVPGQAMHAITLSFSLPVGGVRVELPEVIEGGSEFSAAVVAARSFTGSEITSMAFELVGSSTGTFRRASGVTATPVSGRLAVRFDADATASYDAGDTLGLLTFGTTSSTGIQRFDLQVGTTPAVANDGLGSMVYAIVGNAGGPLDDLDTVGRLQLPAPLLKAGADSVTWINGTCERILQTRNGATKSALAILGLRPQPVATGGERSIEVDLRDMPAEGGTAELLSADGTRLGLYPISPSNGSLIRLRFDLPEGIASGVYFLRVLSTDGTDVARVVVVD